MISVIIPVYNTESYLRECLVSVLEQTCQDFEIVLVDDGSTDSSLEICREFAKKDSRIHFYTQKHQGVSAARNTALDRAHGDAFFFLDSDDVIHPSLLERLDRQMRRRKVRLAFCGQKRTVSAGDYRITKKWVLLDSRRLIRMFSSKGKVLGGIGGKLLARDAVGELRFEPSRRLGEDTIFLYELIRKGIDAVYTPDTLYCYRRREDSSALLKNSQKGLREARQVIKRIEAGEQECGRLANARNWEGEYIKLLHHAMEHFPENDLHAMRREVAGELKNPYFWSWPPRTWGSVLLAFFCYPLYRSLKTAYRFCKGKKRKTKKNECCGCAACSAVCPFGAIRMKEDCEGFSYPQVDEKKCTGCGLCADVCPMKHEIRAGKEQTYIGAQAKSDALRFASSSGGAFPVLAQYVLSQNGVVFGAAMEADGSVRHREITKIEEIPLLQKTKYVQSDIINCYKRIKQQTEAGRLVLFTGTPCQCQAIKQYAGEKNQNLLLADLVCYGVPSPGLWRRYRRELEKRYKGRITAFCFRDKRKKDNGHTVAMKVGEKEYAYPMNQDIFCWFYFKNYSLRPSCHVCSFCTADRESDLTMGDFWGVEKVRPEFDDGMGTSLLILHNERAVRLFEAIKEEFRYFYCRKEEALQPRLCEPTSWPGRRRILMPLSRVLPLHVTKKLLRK